MSNGYLKFTGDYAALKKMGYTFQKLYANNYMSWHKGDIFIFKKGSDITSGSLNLYKFVVFMRTNPLMRIGDGYMAFFKFYADADTDEYEYLPHTPENIQRWKDNMDEWGKVDANTPRDQLPPHHTVEVVGKEIFNQLQELNDLGWYEPVKC